MSRPDKPGSPDELDSPDASPGQGRTSRLLLPRRWLIPIAAAVAVSAVVLGVVCSGPGSGDGGGLPGDQPAGPAPDERQLARAREVVARWDAGIGARQFVPVDGQPRMVGEWEPAVGSNNKLAVLAGRFVAVARLPDAAPPSGTVRLSGGAVQSTPVLSAADTLLAMTSTTGCACTPLAVTGASATTMMLQTTRGEAVVPAWRFRIRGTRVQILRHAVSAPTIGPMPYDAGQPWFLRVESVTRASDGGTLTAHFVGSPGRRGEACGADYGAHVVESAKAIAVIIVEDRNPAEVDCRAAGAMRTATVHLAQPLDERAVLEVQEGMPVPVAIG